MRHGVCPDLGGVQSFVVQRFDQSPDSFIDRVVTIRLPQRELHGRCCRSVRRRSDQTLDDHLIEEQLLADNEIRPRIAVHLPWLTVAFRSA